MNSSYYGTDKKRGGLWSILNRFLIAGIIVVLTIGAAVTFIPLFHQQGEQAARIAQLKEEAAKEKKLLARRTREVELLRSNPEYVEIIARDRLDKMKPGETILRFESSQEPVTTPSTSALPTVP